MPSYVYSCAFWGNPSGHSLTILHLIAMLRSKTFEMNCSLEVGGIFSPLTAKGA